MVLEFERDGDEAHVEIGRHVEIDVSRGFSVVWCPVVMGSASTLPSDG